MRSLALLILAGWLALTVSAEANFGLGGHGGPGAGTTPVITFGAPSASYTYPSASGTTLTTVTATTNVGSFLGGGGTFTTSNCPASNIAVASAGAVTVAGPSNLTGNQSCTITANYPGATSVPQTFTLTGTQQTIASVSPPCSLGGGCVYTFTNPATALVLGSVPTVTMSGGISFSAGGGAINLGTGLQCSAFAVVSGMLQITEPNSVTDTCTYGLTDPSASNSPQTVSISATGSTSGTQNVTAVMLTNENVVPGSASAPVGTLSATINGTSSLCVGCTFTMVNSGSSSQGVGCSSASNDFTISGTSVSTVGALTAQIYGQLNPLAPLHSYPCFEATPPVGSAWIQPLSIMVRNPTFLAFAPLTAPFMPGGTTTIPLTTAICWTNCHQGGSPPTVTYALGSDAACTATGISISGSNLVIGPTYVLPSLPTSPVCHITATAAGVGTGMIGTSGSSYVAAITLISGAYVGAGDTGTYPNGATSLASSAVQFGMPWAYSVAYAAAGGPIWQVENENGQITTINATAAGDLDVMALDAACQYSMCYQLYQMDQTQLLSSSCRVALTPCPNDLQAWGVTHTAANIVTQRPIIWFDAANGANVLPWPSNSTDRGMCIGAAGFGCSGTYNGSGTTGTIWNVSSQSGAHGGRVLNFEFTGTGSTRGTALEFTSAPLTIGGDLYVGNDSGSIGSKINAGPMADGVLHSMIGVLNGSSSILNVDGTDFTTITSTGGDPTPMVANLSSPEGQNVEYGGGSTQGGVAPGSAVWSGVTISSQRQMLCYWAQWHLGTPGTC